LPVTASLAGTGLTSVAIGVSPAQLSFAGVPVGTTSASQAVNITNNGGTPANGLTLSATGPFAIAQNGCGATLVASASCAAAVVFTATQNGPASGALVVHAANFSPDATVALLGTGGLTGVLQAQPASIMFPVTGVGNTSNAVTVTLTNSSATYSLQNFGLSASAGFQVASTCGASLAAGASCTASLTFAPSAAGPLSGALTISSSTMAANSTVALSGTGFDFTLGPGSGSTSQAVASGQTANYTLSLSAGATGATFMFACGSLPQYASCVFSPSSTTLSANGTAAETVQITTSQASAQIAPNWRPGWPSLVMAGALICMPFLARRRRALIRLLAITIVLTAWAAGCAGGGGGAPSTPPSSPSTHSVAPGTYSIQAQATANGLKHEVTLKITVN
jgi:hypothetical protein